ncbi:four helix bundle protein [Bacteroidota bacterium]
MNALELENRLIRFAASVINFSDHVKKTRAGIHLAGQIVRSGTSPALNYAEARSAESKKDFIHKLCIVLKELRETFVCLCIIELTTLANIDNDYDNLKKENNELVALFTKSIKTLQNKQFKNQTSQITNHK